MNSILLRYFLLKEAKYYILLYRQILSYALGQKLENSINENRITLFILLVNIVCQGRLLLIVLLILPK